MHPAPGEAIDEFACKTPAGVLGLRVVGVGGSGSGQLGGVEVGGASLAERA